MEAPSVDVYLSYSRRDEEAVAELERRLLELGLRVWRAGTGISAVQDWRASLSQALARARFVGVCIGPSGIGPGQLREIEAVQARAESDPDFPFAAVLLPGVAPDLPPSALPIELQTRQWLDLRSGYAAIRGLKDRFAEPPETPTPEVKVRSTPSVNTAAGGLTGEVTATALVAALLVLHPEYGGRKGGSVRKRLDAERGARASPDEWITRVRGLLIPDAATEIHGRLLIVGLARVDQDAREELERDGFLGAVEREIRGPIASLFRAAPPLPEETVPTFTDNPATVDELNREGYARILARRIRDMRQRETDTAKTFGDDEFPRGRSFLVHVHCPWGVGKTSLLNFLNGELRKSDPDRWVVVSFNAWQHQRLAPPWWWLMTVLYRRGYRELRDISRRRAALFRAREWLWRLWGGWQGLVMVLIGAGLFVVIWRSGFFRTLTLDGPFSIDAVKGAIVGLAAVLTPFLVIWGAARSAGRWLLTTSSRGARIYIENARDPMQTMKEHFKQLVDWIHNPLAIVVDDLDRCKPTYVVELLEGVQTLFRDVPVTYVIAADREWVAASYASEYESFKGAFDAPGRPLGYLFVEKTFQMTLAVPAMNESTRDGYWRRLIRQTQRDELIGLDDARKAAGLAFGGIDTEEEVRAELAKNPGVTPVEQRARLEAAAIQLATPKLERATEHALQPFRPLLDANPRAMKRLVNAYGLARGIELLARGIELLSQGSLGGDKGAQQRTALWTILTIRWPRLAEYLADHPESADAFEKTGSPPTGVPADFVPLFADPQVRAVVLGEAEGVDARLNAASIRLAVTA